MFSTSFKIAFGYVLLIVLMFVSIGYVYRQMNLLISSTDMEKNVVMRRRLTNDIISTLYKAEITGQNLRLGSVGEYPVYRNTMQEAVVLIHSLQKVMSSDPDKTDDCLARLSYRQSGEKAYSNTPEHIHHKA